MKRRELIAGFGAASAWAAVARGQQLQTYPSRPVKIIVGQAAGSASDIARLIAQFLSEETWPAIPC